MKKIFYLMSLLALALVSCNKEEPFKLEQTEDGQYVYRFTVNNEHAAWKAGDQLAVFDAEGTILGLAELSESSAGQTKGAFSLTIEPLLADGTKLLFQYPYVEEAEILTGQVAVKQTSSLEGVGAGANGLASAEVDFKQQNLEVTLAPVHAYVKLNVSSSAFAEYTLEGATLWAAGAQLAGNVAVAEGDVTVTKPADYVKTTIAEPAAVGTGANALVLAVLPADLAGKTVWAIVHMTKGTETVTLPVQITESVALEAGEVKEITLSDLTVASAPSWYQPIETRYIAAYGEGWSYGPENTVLFTEDGQEKVVELKARGNFMKVKQPAKVKINNVSDQNGAVADRVYINDVDGNNKTSVDLDANCSVKVKMKVNSGAGYCSSMLVQDKDGKTIWGINLWLSHDGVQTAAYDNGTVMDRNIGSSKVSSEKKHYTCNGVYFQWGRPFGFPWSTSNKGTTHAPTASTNTLQTSAENPFTMFRYDNGGNGDGFPWDWYWGDGSNKNREGDLDDLWGNPNENAPVLTESGKKSIFDPCPKGYRVASAAIIEELNTNIQGELEGSTFKSTGPAVVYTDNTTLHYVEYKGISWGFHGLFAPNTGMQKIGDAKTGAMAFWSNANHDANGHHLYFRINGTKLERVAKRVKNAATPIRCMVDTENR